VVSHEAFGYIANAYGFEQVGISGLSPEAEPSPARLAEVAKIAKAENATTIYYESLVDPKVAKTLADELKISAEMLDPLESPPASGDYLSVMAQNLDTLVKGQVCS
jgi:zinc transport system substrate-binding protein